ncbi:enoyl-CoA hydratase/isomerase family protein [Rhodococcus sp. BP-349]|uniref:enoyl-CoA hydratase-related protein n=1 Tax=unclassified Rhodococcus (in: high G+C Gram-positive bacteria) TaxID=192944 RepID=UPI001C9BA666|nr:MULTISPECIES: enoyl-CoA hydratase-related protein [unclassified Rhodococcus (in: high G+C Gram-positive bacteria)]MBY6537884.1 enoyl-CoA hydratase/isomerase family protein [Rhodococcus sp. BP-363]MBY6542221.1 enoyl-CoA hydratase/isomerase family protein [Rhodococcus sp. BP-369]MBY6561451.1 enoyl-CoA hydratase/isomerase family protein [Rhodococcus sp. BP-370]MBY6575743.1 enoyl-CoA hydratase/isomerase family protein [Rhodococcus sp. BP-364]MBY6585044.1 enoyl-CoA hydratase/isomerase family pro
MTATVEQKGSVSVEIDGAVAWAVISNPTRRNALSAAMMRDLHARLQELDTRPDIRAIVLRGEGSEAFVSGADISEFESQHGSTDAKQAADDAIAALFFGLAAMHTPTIAMVHGFCMGAGVAVALTADIRIADEACAFAIPAARLGIAYPVPPTRVLQRMVGSGHAAEMLYTGGRVTAETALSIGLVNRVVPKDQLHEAVRTLATTIAANSPMSVRAAKVALASDLYPEMLSEAEAFVAMCTGSDDAVEGGRAFMEKRRPKFTGVMS